MTAADRLIDAGYEDVVIFENPGYDTALIGVSEDGRAIYDYDLMIDWLKETQNFSTREAVDWIDYNTIRALPYCEASPIIMFSV